MLYAILASQAMWACELGGVIESGKRSLSGQWHGLLAGRKNELSERGRWTLLGLWLGLILIATMQLYHFATLHPPPSPIISLSFRLFIWVMPPHYTIAPLPLCNMSEAKNQHTYTFNYLHQYTKTTLPHSIFIKLCHKVVLQQRNLLSSPHYN